MNGPTPPEHADGMRLLAIILLGLVALSLGAGLGYLAPRPTPPMPASIPTLQGAR